MATIYYEKDTDLGLLNNKLIGVIGYGSQGHAHALNLRDSGCDVVVGLYPGSKSWERAEAEGLRVITPDQLTKEASVIMMLVPDTVQKQVFEESVEPFLDNEKTLMFAHGFNIHFEEIAPSPEIDVAMIAPKGPGHRVRELYVEGAGIPGLVAIHQDASGNALQNALAYGMGIGCLRAGIVATTFKEETETDLFGEQAVLCGGTASLIKADN